MNEFINEIDEAFQAVDENNRINDGKWSDWDSAYDILETYEITYESEWEDFIVLALNTLIRDEGRGADHYIETLRMFYYGA